MSDDDFDYGEIQVWAGMIDYGVSLIPIPKGLPKKIMFKCLVIDGVVEDIMDEDVGE